MNNVLVFTIILYFQYTLVQCLVPNLNVRRVDKTTIAKKRQDTVDMCRIFTEENSKNIQMNRPIMNVVDSYRPRPHGRYKRSPLRYAVNPTLNDEDVERIESIVDKFYDDVDDSLKVKYVKGQKKDLLKRPGRRFDFAPSKLLGTKYPNTTDSPKPITKHPDPYNPDDDQNRKARWRQGVIPYFIDPKTYDTQLAEQIVAAFDYVEKATCIRLQRLREKPDLESLKVNWVYVSNPLGIRQCVHSNENKKLDGVQMSVIGYDCISQGDIVHEIMHILGYSHEHLRTDRDQHISVLWDNIKSGYRKYFDINGIRHRYNLESLPYDYASILHYPPRAFSKNGQATIKVEEGVKIGQREALSEIDLQKVSLIYSAQCFARNKDYLDKTCATVMKTDIKPAQISPDTINGYFKDRLWPLGIISYTFRDTMEFTPEERENIRAVFSHIEKETCIKFKYEDLNDESANFESSETFIPLNQNASVESSKESSETVKQINEKNQNVNASSESLKGPPKRVKPYKINPYKKSKKQTLDNSQASFKKLSNKQTQFALLSGKQTPSTLSSKKQTQFTLLSGKQTPSTLLSNKQTPFTLLSGNQTPTTLLSNKQTQFTLLSGKQTPSTLSSNKQTPSTLLSSNSGPVLRKAIRKQFQNNMERKARPMRRHVPTAVRLLRSSEPGCKCPTPGRPKNKNSGPSTVQDFMNLTIHEDCFNSVNDLLHFFVHVLGLDHQHNMYDRDSYLYIIWDNLNDEMKKDLQNKLPPAASVGFPYDYQSVMHYPWLDIKNGKTSVMYPLWNDGWSMGHWQGLSSTDVQKLNYLYSPLCSQRNKQNSLY